jgi:hypothetical protein
MKEQVMVYEIKSSANTNADVLFSPDRAYFYWNDTAFKNLKLQDFVFVVNTHSHLVLFTRLDLVNIEVQVNDGKTTFSDLGNKYNVSGKWDIFIRLKVIKELRTPEVWKWKSLGNSETTYLNGQRINTEKSENRILNINQIQELTDDSEITTVLSSCVANFSSNSLSQEILVAIQSENIQKLIQSDQFFHQLALDKWNEFKSLKPQVAIYETLFKSVTDGISYNKFLASYSKDSDEYKILRCIGELIAYMDYHAANKNEYNQYDDKRILAKSSVRQGAWIKNLLRYKIDGHSTANINAQSIVNSIGYLENPLIQINMTSDDHRKMVSHQILKREFDKSSFAQSLLDYFKQFNITPKNPINLTRIISSVLYSPNVKGLWVLKSDVNEETEMTNKEIIEHAHAYMTSIGFSYQYEELANFYLALKAKPFVILAGISGTGKTQLPRKFAEAIGLIKDEQVIQVPVRPDWTDGSDLLGYTALDNMFKPKDLTLAIQTAAKNPSKPYLFILDEKNLARVEHYSSDFLSVIETREWDNVNDNILTDPIIRSEVLKVAINSAEYTNLQWPKNLYLIGTVNMDETTHAFSKKVLDRANSIEMNEVNLNWSNSNGKNISKLNGVANDFFETEFITSIDLTEEDKQGINEEMELLKSVNNILQKADLHFAYRVRDEVAFYLILNKKYELMNSNLAIDFQLVQKILPRIHGSSERVQIILVELLNLLEGKAFRTSNFEYSQINGQLDINNLKYRRSSKKILFMLKRFDDDRFTSFWL